MQLNRTTTRREFHPRPDVPLTIDDIDALVDEARKQYHRDYNETTRDKPGWLKVSISPLGGTMHFYYDYVQETSS